MGLETRRLLLSLGLSWWGRNYFNIRDMKSAILFWSPAAFVPWRCLKRVNYRLSRDLHFKCDFQNRNELRPTCYNDSFFYDVIAIMCHYWQSTCLRSGGWNHQWLKNFFWNANGKWHVSGCFWHLSRCKRNKNNTACWQVVDYTDNQKPLRTGDESTLLVATRSI